jgi:hypothetical protein
MAIEEQIRDTKGARFGLKLVWTQIKTPQALARFTLFIGLAVLLLTAIGYAVAMRHPNVPLTSKKKGPRLSFLTIGCLFFYYFLSTQTLSLKSLKKISLHPHSAPSHGYKLIQKGVPKSDRRSGGFRD